jgi:hypothetical protein
VGKHSVKSTVNIVISVLSTRLLNTGDIKPNHIKRFNKFINDLGLDKYACDGSSSWYRCKLAPRSGGDYLNDEWPELLDDKPSYLTRDLIVNLYKKQTIPVSIILDDITTMKIKLSWGDVPIPEWTPVS